MGKVIIINGSPRAPRSNSKKYGEIFRSYYKGQADTFNITKNNHKEICSKIGEYKDMLLVFPLYADGLPVTMPISKNMYLKASTNYWINYGKRNGITKSQMKTMSIE